MYLLALNRFYTPEYMATSSNGGELASVASSTISSQITNILGQISDKWSIAPSFRSDKGDFSDTEVDPALSSRLLNNRLLINGNFGYRDRTTSQTTFVGDFDIEYLLNRSGNLRLKAYNHFNDRNYYLRSSLTTQGIGIIYRRDFDNPFTFLRRKRNRPSSYTRTLSRKIEKRHQEPRIHVVNKQFPRRSRNRKGIGIRHRPDNIGKPDFKLLALRMTDATCHCKLRAFRHIPALYQQFPKDGP